MSSALLVENIPGQAEQRSGVGQKVFGFSPEFVFGFSPEWCSESSRNAVRLQPGMVFAFSQESCSGCPGIRTYIDAGHIGLDHREFRALIHFGCSAALLLLHTSPQNARRPRGKTFGFSSGG
jgi:hypothetical protein